MTTKETLQNLESLSDKLVRKDIAAITAEEREALECARVALSVLDASKNKPVDSGGGEVIEETQIG